MNISLKSQNMPLLIALALADYFLFVFFMTGEFSLEKWSAITLNYKALGASFAVLMLGIGLVNSLLSNGTKEFLVFFKTKNALPGHEAFSKHALNDNRIDLADLERSLGSLPEDAVGQNRAWYSIYKRCREVTSVKDANKNYLLYRDCTALIVLLGVMFGVWGAIQFPDINILLAYIFVNCLIWFLFAKAARNHACKLVCNVLAENCSFTEQGAEA